MINVTLLSGPALGDVRSTIVDFIAVIEGQTKAQQMVTDAENYVKAQAKAGAEQAIPDIKFQVQKAARPYVVGGVVAGSLGFLTGIVALISVRKLKRRS